MASPTDGASVLAPPEVAIDPARFRETLGRFVTGVTVITTIDAAGVPAGVTVNSFSSLSLDPPLVLWSQARAAGSHAAFSSAERFTVNILSEDQAGLSERFARHKGNRFEGVATHPGLGAVPLIEGCSAHLECRVVNRFPGGDHVIFVGQVERLQGSTREPLVFGLGRYLRAAPHEFASRSATEGDGRLQERVVRLAGERMGRLAQELRACVALAVWGNHGPTILRWEQPLAPLRNELRAGLVCAVTTTATGCVFAAFMESKAVQRCIAAELLPVSGEATASVEARIARFEAMRAETRGLGACVLPRTVNPLSGMLDPLNAVSVPVLDGAGRMVAALTTMAPDGAGSAGMEEATSALKDAAHRLSGQLGQRQPIPA